MMETVPQMNKAEISSGETGIFLILQKACNFMI